MSTIKLTRVEEGEKTSAATTNNNFSAFQTLSTQLEGENLGAGALGRQHFQTIGAVHNYWMQKENEGYSGPYAYSNTTWTKVTHGNPLSITPNKTLEKGDVIQLGASIMVETAAFAAGTAGDYEFCFYWNTGSGLVPIDSMTYSYAYLTRTSGLGAENQYNYRRHNFELIYIHTAATTPTVSELAVMVRVGATGSSITINQTNFWAAITKH